MYNYLVIGQIADVTIQHKVSGIPITIIKEFLTHFGPMDKCAPDLLLSTHQWLPIVEVAGRTGVLGAGHYLATQIA